MVEVTKLQSYRVPKYDGCWLVISGQLWDFGDSRDGRSFNHLTISHGTHNFKFETLNSFSTIKKGAYPYGGAPLSVF